MYDYWNEDAVSEYDQMILDFKEYLRDSVKQEVANEISELKDKLAELKEIESKWDEKCREVDEERYQLQQCKREAEKTAKRCRLSELMESIEQEAWTLKGQYEYILPKCDKCDKDRVRHFKSPLGRDMKEPCECAKRKYIYRVEPLKLYKIHQRVRSNGEPDDVWLYYALYKSNGYFNGDVDEDIELVNIRLGEKEHRERYHPIFFDRDDAQEYAEESNAEARTENG